MHPTLCNEGASESIKHMTATAQTQIGKTSNSATVVGHAIRGDTGVNIVVSGNAQPLYLNRQTDDGTLVLTTSYLQSLRRRYSFCGAKMILRFYF